MLNRPYKVHIYLTTELSILKKQFCASHRHRWARRGEGAIESRVQHCPLLDTQTTGNRWRNRLEELAGVCFVLFKLYQPLKLAVNKKCLQGKYAVN